MKRIACLLTAMVFLIVASSCVKEESPSLNWSDESDENGAVSVVPRTTMVTLIEGMTVEMIADTLQKNGVCDADEFLNTLQTADFDRYDFVKAIPQETRDQAAYYLEGYLFPDTYEFYLDCDAYSVACKLLSTFENRVTEDMLAVIEEKGMTLHEMVTTASIIQKEAGFSYDMPRVSRVIHNRLKQSTMFPRLEMDSTISYVQNLNGDFAERDLGAVYNTYRMSGLPVGAICNAGLAALEAAVYPSEEEDILNCYYFGSIIETGETRFFETYGAFEAWCRKVGIGIYGD